MGNLKSQAWGLKSCRLRRRCVRCPAIPAYRQRSWWGKRGGGRLFVQGLSLGYNWYRVCYLTCAGRWGESSHVWEGFTGVPCSAEIETLVDFYGEVNL
jgi:hypothetical protein